VIINFWATWCAPCKKEMPSLDRFYQDKNFKNLQVFAVNMEQPNKLTTKKFFTDLNIKKLEIFFDGDLNFVKQLKLRGVPTTVLINKKGEEFARILGEINFQDEKFLKWLSKYD
jgi:thiol-disulfide isomerase/thioredoxin